MYLSAIAPAPQAGAAAAIEWSSLEVSEQEWLRTFFGEGSPPPDFLYRRTDGHAAPQFHVVSPAPPRSPSSCWDIRTRTYAPLVGAGTRLHFDLRASPAVVETRDGKSQRQDAVSREKGRLLRERGLESWAEWRDADKPSLEALIRRSCGEWLQSRAARHGFEVQVEGLTTSGYRVHGPNSQLRVWHGTQEYPTLPRDCDLEYSTIDFRGELIVVDPVTFAFALQRGIGRGKSVGCGLLLIDDAELRLADSRGTITSQATRTAAAT
ncbi:MAG TPA: type I-E CRISPR-associated protein Cas6/Cse3/CasE [Steroidobacteraceae bacterium]|jgi:CRISPR system Cascade subunit CasE